MTRIFSLILCLSVGFPWLRANEAIDSTFAVAYASMRTDLPGAIQLVNELEMTLVDTSEKDRYHHQAARFFAAIGNFEEEAIHWKKKMELLPPASDTLHKTRYHLGRAYMNAAKWEEAKELYLIFESHAMMMRDTGDVAAAYDAFATIANYQGNKNESIRFYLTCLRILKLQEDDQNRSQVYANMSLVYDEMGNSEKAFEARQNAYDHALKSEVPYQIHKTEMGLAAAYNDFERTDEAIVLLKNAETYFEEQFNIRFLNGVYNELGRSYSLLKEYEISERYFSKSIDLLESNGYQFALPGTLVNYAQVLNDLGQYRKAVMSCQEAYPIVKSLNYPSVESEVCGCLYTNFKMTGQYDSALFYHERRIALEDSINNMDVQKGILEKELTSTFADEKEVLLTNADQEIKQEVSQKYFWIIGFVMILVIAALLFWAFRQKQRANQSINAEKEYLDNLLHNLVHEFRTPLTLIKGPTEELLKKDKDNELLQMVNRNSDQVLLLVNQVLDFAKIKAGRLEVILEQTDLKLFLQDLIDRFQPAAIRKKIKLDLELSGERTDLLIDADKVFKVASNLISNAIKYSEVDGAITVSAEIHANKLTLTVTDRGIGISPENEKKVFEKFFQVDATTTRKAEGTGLGLTFVKELVELMDGNISLSSKLGLGTEVVVNLPVQFIKTTKEKTETIQETHNNPDHLSLTTDDAVPQDHQTELLIVEDNPDLAQFLSAILQAEGYHITLAKDGVEGLERAKASVPSLIISDVMMPRMDGYQLVEKLKSDEITDHIPIIVLTAKASYDSMLDGFGAGANDYVSKPFKTKELLFRVNNQLQLLAKQQEKYTAFAEKKQIDQKHPLVEKIESFVSADFSVHLSADELAEKCALSRSQLHRKIKSITGYSTSVLQTKIRLRTARTEVEKGELSISEIAYTYGYSDPAHFSKLFKKEFGQTPSALKNQ